MVKSQSETWMPSNCEISQRHPNWWTNMTIVTERRWEGLTVGCQGLWQYVKKLARSRSYKKKAKQSTNRVRRRPSNGPGLCKTAPTDLPSPQVPFWHILIQPIQNWKRKYQINESWTKICSQQATRKGASWAKPGIAGLYFLSFYFSLFRCDSIS